MGEVESQPVGAYDGAPLFHACAQGLPQHGVQEVGRRVVPHDGLPARCVDVGGNGHAGLELGGAVRVAMVDDRVAVPCRVQHGDPVARFRLQPAGVAHLSAGLGVERSPVEDDEFTFTIHNLCMIYG